MNRRLPFALVMALAVATAAVACGDDDEPTTPPATASAPTATATGGGSPSPTQPATATTVAPTATRPAATATPTTPAGYGTAPQSTAAQQPGGQKSILVAVRTANRTEDGGTDRIVFEFTNGRPEARVEYRASLSRCGPGDLLDLGGFSPLVVGFLNTDAHNDQGQVSVVTSLGTTLNIRQVKIACDFEALVQYGVGVQTVRPFKVSVLDSPPRVVIDIINN